MTFHSPGLRAVHFDMKSMIPTAEYALSLADELSEQGFNALLVEFEDKFPFDAFPAARHRCAWSKEQFRAFAARCKERGMEIIPLLQSVGHLDYFLKVPEYRRYRDGGENGTSYQWCPANPETFDLWRKMAEEILEVFPDCRHFHIGADECRFDVDCPCCNGADRFSGYTARLERCADFLIGHGKKVVVWDDVFRHHPPEQIGRLFSKVIPCVWQYREINPEFIRRMLSFGGEVWGASCVQAHRRYFAMGPQEPKLDNIDDWGHVHGEYPLAGHIGTIWGRIQCQSPIDSVLPQSLYATGYLGETLQHGVIADRSGFAAKFAATFFGAPEIDLEKIVRGFYYEPEAIRPELEKLCEQAARHRDIAEVWKLFNDIDCRLSYIHMCFDNNHAMLPLCREKMAPQEMLANWLDGCRRISEEIPARLAEIRSGLERYFPAPMAAEFLDQRFASRFGENRRWRRILQKAEKERLI